MTVIVQRALVFSAGFPTHSQSEYSAFRYFEGEFVDPGSQSLEPSISLFSRMAKNGGRHKKDKRYRAESNNDDQSVNSTESYLESSESNLNQSSRRRRPRKSCGSKFAKRFCMVIGIVGLICGGAIAAVVVVPGAKDFLSEKFDNFFGNSEQSEQPKKLEVRAAMVTAFEWDNDLLDKDSELFKQKAAEAQEQFQIDFELHAKFSFFFWQFTAERNDC